MVAAFYPPLELSIKTRALWSAAVRYSFMTWHSLVSSMMTAGQGMPEAPDASPGDGKRGPKGSSVAAAQGQKVSVLVEL